MSQDDPVSELFEFLNDSRPEIKQIAVSNVSGLTSSKDYFHYFKSNSYSPIKTLMSLVNSETPGIAHDSIKALINLSLEKEFALVMNEPGFLKSLILLIILPKTLIADLCCMLLNNLSTFEFILESLLCDFDSEEESDSKDQDPCIKKNNQKGKTCLLDNLIEVFARGEGKRYNPNADFNFLSGVLSNLTTIQKGTKFMSGLSRVDGSFRLSKMIAFLGHSNSLRRAGVSSVLKNVCFDTSLHEPLIWNPDLNLLPYVLLPLAGPDGDFDEEELNGLPDELQFLESTKTIEPDPKIRLILVEILLLLCSTRKIREHFREKQVYAILKRLHSKENSEEIQEPIERIVQLLMRDEAPLDIIKENNSNLDIGIHEE